jgi:vacuolar-type H+-ATPase subunit C/Vma6
MAQSLCESAKWECMLEMAPSSYARFVTRCRIDLENIKSLIRVKRTDFMGEGQEYIWIDGGDIERLTLDRFLKEPEDEIYSYLSTSRYSWLTDHGLNGETALWKIDPLILKQLFNLMFGSRYRYFDIGPVIYHLEIRERNIMLLRSVITGKINHLPDNDMLEMVETILPS